VSRIQHLRLELQLSTPPRTAMKHLNMLKTRQWSLIRFMTELKTFRIVATFNEDIKIVRDVFYRFWYDMRCYRIIFQELIEAVPLTVEIKTGLTKEEKILGDFAGWYPVKGCVLREILKTYKGLQGTYLEATNHLDLSLMYDRPIDGDGDDSDEEAEVQV
jgi:hypothetical protein